MDPNTNKEAQDYTPPYLSLPRIEKLFELLSSRSFTQLTVDDLVNRGYSKNDAFLVLNTLKFLGFMDEKEKMQNINVLALRGEARTSGLKEVVKKAYEKLFSRVNDVSALSKVDLYNEFIAEYHLSPRLAQPALTAFLWLCKESGIDIPTAAITKPRGKAVKGPIQRATKENPTQASKKPMVSNFSDAEYHTYNLAGGVILIIPKNNQTDLIIATGGLTQITEKISDFAEATGLVEKVEAETKNTGGVAE